MRPDRIDAFLAETRHAIAGVIRSDGAPQLSPVWFVYEDGKLCFSIQVAGAKYRQLERDPRVCVCVDAGHPDTRAVTIHGTAALHRERSGWAERVHWKILRRYHEPEAEARAFHASMESDGPSALVVVTPHRIVGRAYN